ncbi:hypothetical protein AgCh_006723 [Apium graveolens]
MSGLTDVPKHFSKRHPFLSSGRLVPVRDLFELMVCHPGDASPATSASAVGSAGGSSALGTYASIPTEAFAPERPMPPFLPLTPLLTNRESSVQEEDSFTAHSIAKRAPENFRVDALRIERSIAIMGSHGFTVLEVNHPFLKDLGSDF